MNHAHVDKSQRIGLGLIRKRGLGQYGVAVPQGIDRWLYHGSGHGNGKPEQQGGNLA